MIITIPRWKPPSNNSIYSSNSHWTRKTEADAVHTICSTEAKRWLRSQNALQPYFKDRVDISIICFFENRPYDSSNIPVKLIEDALKGIIIIDDTPKYVRTVSSTSEVDKANPRVEIHINPVAQT